MKFTGQWHNPDYSGEGITSIEYADGKVVAYFFSYHDDGSQMWLVCVGDRDDTTAELQAYRTEGGAMGDKVFLKEVTEEEWGSILLSEDDEGMLIDFFETGKPGYGYRLTPLYAPVEPTAPQIRITRERLGRTQELDAPLISGMDTAPAEYTLHVEGAPLKIDRAWAVGSNSVITRAYKPTLSGVADGENIQPGESRVIRCGISGDWEQEGYELPRVNYVITTVELGTVFNLALPVKGVGP